MWIEWVEFIRGCKPSEQLQARLDVMKTWSPKRLAAAVPAWAKPNLLPKPFAPNLKQHLPNFCTSYVQPWSADLFRKADAGLTTADYVDVWHQRLDNAGRMHYRTELSAPLVVAKPKRHRKLKMAA